MGVNLTMNLAIIWAIHSTTPRFVIVSTLDWIKDHPPTDLASPLKATPTD